MVPLQEDIDFLEHHGVKGQKWGVRRNKQTGVRPIAQTLNDSRFGKRAQKNVDKHNRRIAAKTQKKPSYFERKRQERFQANQKKATEFLNLALKEPHSLIALNGRIVVTGKEFTDHLIGGGLLNVNTTYVFARQQN